MQGLRLSAIEARVAVPLTGRAFDVNMPLPIQLTSAVSLHPALTAELVRS